MPGQRARGRAGQRVSGADGGVMPHAGVRAVDRGRMFGQGGYSAQYFLSSLKRRTQCWCVKSAILSFYCHQSATT